MHTFLKKHIDFSLSTCIMYKQGKTNNINTKMFSQIKLMIGFALILFPPSHIYFMQVYMLTQSHSIRVSVCSAH